MKVFHSFQFAFLGLKYMLEERNFRVHIIFMCIAVVLGVVFSITQLEWLAVIGSIGIVLVAETLNTAIEEAMNLHTSVHPETYPRAGKPKDIGAAGVLLAAGTAICVGCIVFIPYLLQIFVY